RRHPHVFERQRFDGGERADAATLNETWEKQKVDEKGRRSAIDGVPIAQPALALAAKLVARARRAELEIAPSLEDEFGHRLFELVEEAVSAGGDPEAAVRRTTMAYPPPVTAAAAHRRRAQR